MNVASQAGIAKQRCMSIGCYLATAAGACAVPRSQHDQESSCISVIAQATQSAVHYELPGLERGVNLKSGV